MIIDEHKLPLNKRLRLKNEMAEVYPLAAGGAEAFARRRMHDNGFPMIYIEWDKQHWAYSGNPDLWTFETHFELAEPMPKEDSAKDLANDLMAFLSNRFGDEPEESEEPSRATEFEAPPLNVVPTVNNDEEYKEAIAKAFKAASDAEAFLVMGVLKRDVPEGEEGDAMLAPFIIKAYKEEYAGILLEMQASEFAASAHQHSALRLISLIEERSDES